MRKSKKAMMDEKTFDNFNVKQSNEGAFNACFARAKSKGLGGKPLIILGKSGVGKTHLIYAIKNHINETAPHKKVLVLKHEELIDILLDYCRGRIDGKIKENSFAKTLSSDLLLIDGYVYDEEKESTNEEILKTLNELVNMKVQIVVSVIRSARFSGGVKNYFKQVNGAEIVELQK